MVFQSYESYFNSGAITTVGTSATTLASVATNFASGSQVAVIASQEFNRTASGNTATIAAAANTLQEASVTKSSNQFIEAANNGGGTGIAGFKHTLTWDTNSSASSPTYRVQATSSSAAGFEGQARILAFKAGTPGVNNPADTIVLDGTPQTTSGTVSSPFQITLSNFNVGTGNDRVLIVGIEANNQGASTVTYNGGPNMTKVIKHFTNNDAEFWYQTNPANGSHNIVVIMKGSTSVVVGAYSFFGVNQTNPIPTTATNFNTVASSPTISITTANSNSWVLDSAAIYGGKTLSSPTCTQSWNTNILNAVTGASSSKIQASAGSATCSWTASSGDLWDDVAVEVKPFGSIFLTYR